MIQTETTKTEDNTIGAAKPLRVAVTGGSGRIGRHVVKCLLARGHSVMNLDRIQPREPAAKLYFVDLRKREQVQPLLEQVDAVCHLGEIPGLGSSRPPEEIYAHNTQAGSVVLQTAADLKLQRIVYTSSCQVYGCFGEPVVPPARLPFDETHPLQPQNAYAMSKVANEGYGRFLALHRKVSIAIFRFPAVWDWDTKNVSEDHLWMWLRRACGKVDDLSAYLHATDAALAYALAVENPLPGCEAYHFSARDVFSSKPLRERIEKHHPDFPALAADWPAYASLLLCAKAKEHFGWEPAVSILEAYRKKFGKEPHQ